MKQGPNLQSRLRFRNGILSVTGIKASRFRDKKTHFCLPDGVWTPSGFFMLPALQPFPVIFHPSTAGNFDRNIMHPEKIVRISMHFLAFVIFAF